MLQYTKLILVFLLVLGGSFLMAQTSVSGTVVDETGQPLPYAQVYLEGQDCGEVTNENGHFNFSCPAAKPGDAFLRVEYLGYVGRRFSIEEVKNMPTIKLKSAGITLGQVEVVASREVGKLLELKYKAKKPYYYYQTDIKSTYQVASMVKNSTRKEGVMTELTYYIGQAASKASPIRVNFYAFDETCKCPGEPLHQQNIVTNFKKGKNKLDVSTYGVTVPKDKFFVSFEWLPISGKKGNTLDFSIGMLPVKSEIPLFEKLGGLPWRPKDFSNARALTKVAFRAQ